MKLIKKTRDWVHTESQRMRTQGARWQPKTQPSEYAWRAVVISQVSDLECEYLFTNRELARSFKRVTEAALTEPRVVVDRVPMPDGSGFLLR
jgi:hypothetical protein